MSNRTLIFSARKKDFHIDWFSGKGAGGQHRNKHQNCCRITHKETGLMALCQDHRERPANQRVAFRRLVEKLAEHYDWHSPARPSDGPPTKVIRSYSEPRNQVKDHRSGHTERYDAVVGKGNLSGFIGHTHRGDNG